LPLCSSLEVDGTFTSTDRRVQRVRAAAKPVGESRPGWQIAGGLAERMAVPFGYDSVGAIMDEIASLTPLYQGCSYQALEQGWGWQWPVSNGEAEQFSPMRYEGLADAPTEERPFLMAVDPTLNPWDMDAAVRNCWNLAREYGIRRGDFPKGFVQINSSDAADLGVRRGQPVTITSMHGEAKLPAMVTDEVAPKTLMVPGYLRTMVAEVIGETGRPVYAGCAVSVRRG
jgi:formate dehydrogenase major subunit